MQTERKRARTTPPPAPAPPATAEDEHPDISRQVREICDALGIDYDVTAALETSNGVAARSAAAYRVIT